MLSLIACGAQPTRIRTELVDVPVTVYAPLPAALTDPLPLPEPPEPHCLQGAEPAVCALDALTWSSELLDVIDRANEDRATAATLGSEAAAP